MEEEDRIVTHLGAEAKFRVAALGRLGTRKGSYSRVLGSWILLLPIPPQGLQRWGIPAFSNPSACFQTQMKRRDSIEKTKMVPGNRDNSWRSFTGVRDMSQPGLTFTFGYKASLLQGTTKPYTDLNH